MNYIFWTIFVSQITEELVDEQVLTGVLPFRFANGLIQKIVATIKCFCIISITIITKLNFIFHADQADIIMILFILIMYFPVYLTLYYWLLAYGAEKIWSTVYEREQKLKSAFWEHLMNIILRGGKPCLPQIGETSSNGDKSFSNAKL